MWKSIGALLTRTGEALGIEVPDVGAVGEAVTGAVDAVSGQASEAAAGLSETLTGAAGDVAGTASNVSDTVTGVGRDAGDATSPVDRSRG